MTQYTPDSTPTTDVNRFASDELVVVDESVFPETTSFFFASLVPEITRLDVNMFGPFFLHWVGAPEE